MDNAEEANETVIDKSKKIDQLQEDMGELDLDETTEPQPIEEFLKTEVRNMKSELKHQIAEILEHINNFKVFMLTIPKKLDDIHSQKFMNTDEYERKYSIEHVSAIQNASEHQKGRRLNGEILFAEWGTSGRFRPRIVHLLFCLDKAGLRRASNLLRVHIGLEEVYDDIVSEFTNNESTMRTANDDFVKRVLLDLDEQMTEILGEQEQTPAFVPTEEESLILPNIKRFTYNDIKEKTNHFSSQKYEGYKSHGRFVGSGGFGKVYIAVDLFEEERFVAVKVMTETKFADQNLKHYLRELKIISEINHPNIIKLLGYSIDVKACLIYEYASNGSYKTKLTRARRGEDVYELKDRVRHMWEISKALMYLHDEKHLVHRDIKPENILLDGREAKLCDFGLIKPLDEKGVVSNTRAAGTELYMAPESRYGEVTPYADVFAFGLVILEALTNLKLYDNKRVNEQYLNRWNDPDKNIEFLTPSVQMPYNSEVRLKLIEFALICARNEKSERPPIKFIYEKLLERLDC
uniref:CSON013585 protein n=1 Tax=Culicoides sonorensis TaxID=179676 RepID=A0A336MDW3_CULSO